MANTIEWRSEVCGECGDDRERAWAVGDIPRGAPVPAGYSIESRVGSYKRVARPTRDCTLCACDAG